jgi:VanZ family protein
VTSARLRTLRRVPAVAYTVGVFYGGVIDIGALPELPGLSADKVLHGLAFAGLAGLIELFFFELAPARRRVVAAVLSSALGGLLELIQAALPYRSAELWDFGADVFGALVAAGVSWFVGRVARRRLGASEGA